MRRSDVSSARSEGVRDGYERGYQQGYRDGFKDQMEKYEFLATYRRDTFARLMDFLLIEVGMLSQEDYQKLHTMWNEGKLAFLNQGVELNQ